jgi:hypothetical protein
MPDCIYCLSSFDLSKLTDEHVIPLSLGGRIKLGAAACKTCNSQRSQQLDNFLSDLFPPTSLARTDLNLRSYSNASPKTPVVANDPEIGDFELEMRPDGQLGFPPKIHRKDNTLIATGPNAEIALKTLARQMKRKLTSDEVTRTGQIVLPMSARFKHPIDWVQAHRAAAKIFYCYILLELGERFLRTDFASQLRDYVLHGTKPEQFDNKTEVSRTRHIEGGSIDIPQHFHAMMFDSENVANNFICLFGIFMFDFPTICQELIPHGRFASVDPQEKGRLTLTENMTRDQGIWRFRTSIRWGWQRKGTTIPSIVPR